MLYHDFDGKIHQGRCYFSVDNIQTLLNTAKEQLSIANEEITKDMTHGSDYDSGFKDGSQKQMEITNEYFDGIMRNIHAFESKFRK